MNISDAIKVAEALPNPPSEVAPSAAALLSSSYWESTLDDLSTISACLSGLEEHDAVITCRKLANDMVQQQRDNILTRCRRLVAMRSQWMEQLDRERISIEKKSSNTADGMMMNDDHHQNNNQWGVVSHSANRFCASTLEKLAADHDLAVWQSNVIPLPSGGTNSTKGLLLQLKVTQTMAEVLELPETFAVTSTNGTATTSVVPALLSVQGLSSSSAHGNKDISNVTVFRAAPLKRAGTWVNPIPATVGRGGMLGDDDGANKVINSSAPDEDQILYYLRLYLSLAGERANGEFLSEALVREVAALLATQLALFDLTLTSGAKFDLAKGTPPPTTATGTVCGSTAVANPYDSAKPFIVAPIHVPLAFRPCAAITMPSEAAANRPAGPLTTTTFTASVALPYYDPMSIQLHDVVSFSWALKYVYGEVLKGVDVGALSVLMAAGGGGGSNAEPAIVGTAALTKLFVPPSVCEYIQQYVNAAAE